MKKLLVTVIGAAAAIGAFADYTNAVRLEGSGTTISELNTAAVTWTGAAGTYFAAPLDTGNTNEYSIGTLTGTLPTGRPIADENDPETELSVKTQFGKPLEFNVDPAQATKSFEDGLYFDSLVKFTVCDDAPQQEYADAKIVMWLQEDPTGVGDATKTNLYVKAGYLYDNSGSLAVSNVTYKCDNTFDADFADKWHRVTIKAIGTIANGVTVPGFAIFIDGGDDVNIKKVGTTAAKWDANLLDFTEAVENLVTDGQLFPSMQQGDVAGVTTLSCAGFDGTGWLNDLVFTDVVPFDDAKDNVAPKVNVNGKEYTTFEEAVGAVNGITAAGDVTVTLLKDMTLSGTLAFASQTDVNVVFDFAGKVLTNNGSTPAISNAGTLTITNSVGNGGIVCTSTGEAVVSDALAESTLITAGYFDGVVAEQGLGALQISGGSFKYNTMTGSLVEGKEFQLNSDTGLYDVGEATPGTVITIAENPWYENPKAVVLAENLPGQTGNIVSAFHGQGQGEYLGLTYSTNPLQFDLYQVDGTNALVTNRSVEASALTTPGLRGVAISKTLGVAVTLAYATTTTMYAFPLAGGTPTAVTKPSTHSFDAAAFSPDGKYLFSNALNGESSNQFYVKWSVAVDAETGALSLDKVGSIDAGGRARSLAYARIKGRDLVFGLIDSGKIAVIDMTGDTASAWSATDLITDLPAHSYGTLCVSGVTAVDAQGNAATPHLTVATSTNNGATKGDVLNVYALTVPASGAVTASLTKSFTEDALTAGGFGDISDANRYGNTVYVTEDEATIYFARPDNKLYAAQFAYVVDFVVDGVTNSVSVFPGDAVAQADPTKENYIFDGWFLPGAGQAYDLSAPVTQDLTLTAKFTAAEAKVGTTLYLTLKDAVDAADTGDTVTVLSDCSVTNGNTGITFTKGINLVNNYTITIDGANYALRIANGTTTPVTMSGTGSLVWANGSGSPILVGCNEIKSGYGINAFCEGSFVLNGGTLTSTDKTAKGGNLVKLEAGTFVLNGGTINGGTRGVKADSEGNNATCVLTINGGTIVNTNSAAIAASTAGSGSSTVVVNGGTFTGKIVGTGMVTIPGTSTAKFDRDQTSFCESGYETVLKDGWYQVQRAVTPIVPGGNDGETYNTQEAAAEAAAKVEVAVPDAVKQAGVDTTTYANMFEAKVVSDGGTGYKVVVDLKPAIETEIQTAVDTANTTTLGAVLAAETDTANVSVTTKAGLYYQIVTGDSLPLRAPAANKWVMATGTSETIQVTKPEGDAAFFKVYCSPTK